MLASTVILRPRSLNVEQSCFFMISICLGVALTAAKPTSRYKPIEFPNDTFSLDRIYILCMYICIFFLITIHVAMYTIHAIIISTSLFNDS